jgi:hypothetical protein
MLIAIRASLALGATILSLSLFASVAQAAGPATVTVRVEGVNQTLVGPTEVTTTTTPVVKDGNAEHACPGTSAIGALQLATVGNWNGTWFKGLGYSVETIAGETHAFEEQAPANFFWSYWLDNKPSSAGICEGELEAGQSILMFPDCFSESGACPPSPNPLGIAAPTSVEVRSPFTVAVVSYANATGAPSPAVGATVEGAGVNAVTDANGKATLTLPSTGNATLHVSAPESVRTETNVCVHAGNDGLCGASSTGQAAAGGVLGFSSYKGPYAVVARVAGLIDGHRYPRGRAPRTLSGNVLAHASVASVGLKLRRSYRRSCQAYNGLSGRFVSARCGTGSFFKVSSSPSFSYLLPESLRPGRYVLDVQATDAVGNTTKLARGTSRVVFYVR